MRGHKEPYQTSHIAPSSLLLRPADPRTAAGRTLCGKPRAVRGSAPSLLLEQCVGHLVRSDTTKIQVSQCTQFLSITLFTFPLPVSASVYFILQWARCKSYSDEPIICSLWEQSTSFPYFTKHSLDLLNKAEGN